MTNHTADQFIVLMSIKLVQPGSLGDILEGTQRLVPKSVRDGIGKGGILKQLERLIELGLVRPYVGRRYMLTDAGKEYVVMTGIRLKLDARRMFLLKETRQHRLSRRSDTRNGSLKQ